MKRFTYKARDGKTGKIVKGNIQAENERTAGKLLLEQKLTPLSVNEETDGIFLILARRLTTKIRSSLPDNSQL